MRVCAESPFRIGANLGRGYPDRCKLEGGSDTERRVSSLPFSKSTEIANVPEVCAQPRMRHWCFGPGQPTASCTSDFDRGFARMLSPFQWERHDVDPTRTNSSGQVEHGLFCAKEGAPMWKSETDYCCSEKGRNFDFWDGAAFTLAHGAWAFAIPEAQICQ